jgi:tetratricopeptide (TPR) repeat protein
MVEGTENLDDGLCRARRLAVADDYVGALQCLDGLAARHPEEAALWACRAYVEERRGDRNGAIACWTKAIALSGEEPHYFYMRGVNWFGLQKYPEAVADFTRVIELCDHHNSDYYREGAYFFRADSHLRLNEFALARADCLHVSDGMCTWTDRLRQKADILRECTSE